MCQTSVRKDLTCFFGCLQGRFQILRWERHEWSDEKIFLIAQVCIILHNMTDVMRKSGALDNDAAVDEDCPPVDLVAGFDESAPAGDAPAAAGDEPGRRAHTPQHSLRSRYNAVTREDGHLALRGALTDHLWNLRGQCEA